MAKGTSRYAKKLAEKSGMYGKASAYGKSCCAHLTRAVAVDYRNNKRKANAPANKGGPRFTENRTVTFNG